jgi:hypothetical protein
MKLPVELWDKIQNAKTPTGVFMLKRKLVGMSTGTRRYRELRDMQPAAMIGVYDAQVQMHELREDVDAWMDAMGVER